jgi:hypothetical protein
VDAKLQAAITAQANHRAMRLARRPAATLCIRFVLSLDAPVALRSPNQQPNPHSHAEQTDDGTEEDDSGHTPIMAGPGTSREAAYVQIRNSRVCTDGESGTPARMGPALCGGGGGFMCRRPTRLSRCRNGATDRANRRISTPEARSNQCSRPPGHHPWRVALGSSSLRGPSTRQGLVRVEPGERFSPSSR